MDFSERKFLSLPSKRQHKLAAALLRSIFEEELQELLLYRKMETLLALPPLNHEEHEEVSTRYHLHLQHAGLSKKEHSLLHVRTKDTGSNSPFLPVHIYLCSLRSAFNVGSILRTNEAFRLGTIHFSPSTPGIDNPKVQKASMGTYSLVNTHTNTPLSDLPRPWIALETASPSTPLGSYSFPKTFTLFLGNEEFGVPKEILKECDTILEIPLLGAKNSLNVSSAFAITANQIRTCY